MGPQERRICVGRGGVGDDDAVGAEGNVGVVNAGIAQGAGCGRYLAQWMLYGDSEINMTGFDPRRFGAWASPAMVAISLTSKSSLS